MNFPEKIWHNGVIKPWAEATTHVMAHAIHYGSSVFEGIRAYETPKGTAIFRLNDHNKRLFQSAKIYDIVIPYTLDEINAACRDIIKVNGLSKAYLRPIVFRGYGGVGIAADTPIDVAVAAMEFGRYLGEDGMEKGIDACVSSWQRFAPNTLPAGAKAGGNYLSGQLVTREARRHGYGEGIALASTGLLSEGAGENLFLVFDGALHTTPGQRLAARRHHPQLDHPPGARQRHRSDRARPAARIPVPVRRAAHVRHRGGNHPDAFGRRQAGRRRQARTGDPEDPGPVLRPVRGPHRGQARLAGYL